MRPGSARVPSSQHEPAGAALRTPGSYDVLVEKPGPGCGTLKGRRAAAAGQPRVPAHRGSHRRCSSSACASGEQGSEGTPGPKFPSFSFLTPSLVRLPDASVLR